MTKQTETIRDLKDRVNALEAMTLDFLAVALNSEAQAKIKFDDYQIKYTQEAVEKREAEAKAKRLAENFNTAKAEFRDLANSCYWSLVFMTAKEREQKLDDIWQTTITDLELPENAKRPVFVVSEPDEDKLMVRRTELMKAINRTNEGQLKNTISHCEQSQLDFVYLNEKERDKQVAELRKKDKLTEAERQHQIKNTEDFFNIRIKQHVQEMQRQINAAKVQLTKLAQDKAELAKVKKALATLLSQ